MEINVPFELIIVPLTTTQLNWTTTLTPTEMRAIPMTTTTVYQIRPMFNAASQRLSALFQRPSPTMTVMVVRTTVKTATTTTMASAIARNPPPPVLVVLSTGRRATLPLTETKTAVMMQKRTSMTMETALMTKVRTDVGLPPAPSTTLQLGWTWMAMGATMNLRTSILTTTASSTMQTVAITARWAGCPTPPRITTVMVAKTMSKTKTLMPTVLTIPLMLANLQK